MTSPIRLGRPTAPHVLPAITRWALVALALGAAPRQAVPQNSPPDAGARATPTAVPKEPVWKYGRLLRVCADPDNLPFSDRAGEGFENRLAELFARELGDTLRYVWWPQRRGFVRNTLRARECDLVAGVPGNYDPVLTTRPYYRSTYYLVAPASRTPAITSLDDPALRQLRVGVHLIGDDYTHTPPVHALLARGISANVKGFTTYYDEDHHPNEIFDALAAGDIDVAVVWGPLAGYFAARSPVPLSLVPLPDDARSALPFTFDIGVGVRRGDAELRALMDSILVRRHDEVAAILRAYHIPTVAPRDTTRGTTRADTTRTDGVRGQDTVRKDRGAPPTAPPTAPPSAPAAARPAAQPPARPAVDSGPRAQATPARGDMLAVTQSEYNGWKVFAVNCTRCHGEDAVGSTIAPSLIKSLRESVTHEVFVQTVTQGRPTKGMPTWGPLLTTQQIEDLYAYLKARSEARLAPGRPHVRKSP